jgi:hypothetical protein
MLFSGGKRVSVLLALVEEHSNAGDSPRLLDSYLLVLRCGENRRTRSGIEERSSASPEGRKEHALEVTVSQRSEPDLP